MVSLIEQKNSKKWAKKQKNAKKRKSIGWVIKKADNSNSNNTKSRATRRKIFTPFNRKWLANSEYVKIINLSALIWGQVFIIHPILFPFFCIFMFFSPFLAFFYLREWYHWIQREILHQKHLWYWFIWVRFFSWFYPIKGHFEFRFLGIFFHYTNFKGRE